MPERLVPTYCERTGSGAEPRTETVPEAVTPLLLTLIVVKPARTGVTPPLASTRGDARVGATDQVTSRRLTGAPDLSVAVAVIAVAWATDAVVTAGSDSAATVVEAPPVGASTLAVLPPPQPQRRQAATRARRGRQGFMAAQVVATADHFACGSPQALQKGKVGRQRRAAARLARAPAPAR